MSVCVAFSLFVCVLHSSPPLCFLLTLFSFSLLSTLPLLAFSILLHLASVLLVAYFTLGFWPRIMMTRSCPLPHPFLSLFVQHSVCTSHIAIALHIATGTTNSRRSSSDSFCFFLSCSYFCSVIFVIQRFVQRSVAVTFFVHFISVILRCN